MLLNPTHNALVTLLVSISKVGNILILLFGKDVGFIFSCGFFILSSVYSAVQRGKHVWIQSLLAYEHFIN